MTIKTFLFVPLLTTALSGCMHMLYLMPDADEWAMRSASARSTLQHKGLTIYGYNYTDYGFYSFQVDGRGAGTLEPSTFTSAGGSSACCFSLYTPMSNSRMVRVKWSRGIPRGIWCELEVPLRGPLPAKPEYLEVHFYQDGHVELAITEEPSPPRLKLERFSNGQRHATGNVNNDDKFAVCKHGY